MTGVCNLAQGLENSRYIHYNLIYSNSVPLPISSPKCNGINMLSYICSSGPCSSLHEITESCFVFLPDNTEFLKKWKGGHHLEKVNQLNNVRMTSISRLLTISVVPWLDNFFAAVLHLTEQYARQCPLFFPCLCLPVWPMDGFFLENHFSAIACSRPYMYYTEVQWTGVKNKCIPSSSQAADR